MNLRFPDKTQYPAVGIAVSGGADSVAMLHILCSLREALGVTVSAAHFNHRLRGAESDRDEAFVRKLCDDWGVPLAAALLRSSSSSPARYSLSLRLPARMYMVSSL